MRIWDINAGYLNRQSLLGEHRELHGIASIISQGKRGYSRHPETLRWIGYGWALRIRHRQLGCEMALRGYLDRTPVLMRSNPNAWPESYIDPPHVQFELLNHKYEEKEPGRIPLPQTAQELWSQHKYSVLARDPGKYKALGRLVARPELDFNALAEILIETLRTAPSRGGIENAALHMWGHVSPSGHENRHVERWSLPRLLLEIQRRAKAAEEPYLMSSTSLSELMVWI